MNSNWSLYNTILKEYKDKEKPKLNTEINELCISCNKSGIIIEDGIRICINCGITGDEVIEETQEWNNYSDNKKDNSRCGIVNNILPNTTLSTTILGSGGGSLKQLSRWNCLSSDERSLLEVFKIIDDVLKNTTLYKCVGNKAKSMFVNISKGDIKRGDIRKGLIGACIFYSCKEYEYHKTQEEIAKLFKVDTKIIVDGCKDFHKIMYQKDKRYTNNIKPINQYDLIKKNCNLLSISDEYCNIALEVAKNCDILGLTYKNRPSSIASAIIYYVYYIFGLECDMDNLYKKTNVSKITVIKIFKIIIKYKKYLC